MNSVKGIGAQDSVSCEVFDIFKTWRMDAHGAFYLDMFFTKAKKNTRKLRELETSNAVSQRDRSDAHPLMARKVVHPPQPTLGTRGEGVMDF